MDGVLNRRLGDSAFRNTSDLLVFLRLDRLRIFGDLTFCGSDLRLVVLELRLFRGEKLLHGRLFCLRLILKS